MKKVLISLGVVGVALVADQAYAKIKKTGSLLGSFIQGCKDGYNEAKTEMGGK